MGLDYLCFINSRIIIKSYFTQEKMQYLKNYLWFRYLRGFSCSIVIILMISANLIGFGIGNKELVEALIYLLKLTTVKRFLIISTVILSPFTFTMFFIRDLEQKNGIQKKF